MLANDNIRLHITADVDDKTGNAIKNIKGNLKEIPAEVTTKIKADGKQAKKEVDDVNKKLEQLNGKNKEIKVTATGTQALNTINSIKKSLSELPKNVSTKIDINAKETKSQLDSLKKTLNSISKDISTTVKLNHKQADTSIESYKKKLKDITAPIETNTKVRLDTRSALASLNNLNAKLKELKDSDLKLKFSIEGVAAIKALSNGIQSFNKSADAANKKLDKLKNISEILGKIEKNVGINVSINGADETSNRLKEIYGLLKGIRKYSNVKINANANVSGGSPRVQAQPQGSNGNGGSSLGSYASQLKGIVAKAEQAHMRGDAQELARLRQEYVLTTQEMLNFQRQFGNGDYNNAIKKLTPIVQTLQRLGIIARDDLGPIRELNNMQFNWDAQMKASTPRTYKQMAQTEKELAEYARQNGNLAESDNHLRNAARLEAEARSINTALEVQRTLQGNIEQTLKEQIKSLEKIAAEQRMQGDTRNLAYTEARLRQLKQEEQLAKARQNPDAYKGLMQEANVYKEQLANPTLTPEARRQLYTQIINTVSNATRQGLRDGMIDNRQAAKNYQKLMPYARELGVENNLQNEITRLGGATNNAGGQQANNARNEYNDLKRQAVQAIEDINRAWRAGNGTEAEERRLDNILNRMRQIKREAGTLNQSTEANLYTTLANGTQRGSRGYDILSARARQAREKRDTLRTDTGAGTSKNSFANGLAYAIRFIGRSTKGTGSAMEASAQLLKDVQQIGPEAGIFARALKNAVLPAMALMGVFEALKFGAQLAVQGLQTFGNMLVQIGTTIYNALKPGIELFKTMTASRFSFGASILSNGYDENGNKLSDIFKNNKTGVLGISDQLITKAQFDAEMSAFSFEEILRSLQGTLPMLLSKGMSLNEAYAVNKGVAGVAKLIQLRPSQILQEARDLAQGSITARGSQVANALGVTNADLAGKSADEIFKFLMEKFENFTEFVNRFEDTAYGRAQQLEERLATVSEKFVENLSAGFQGIFENLIRFTGEWKGTGKDASGKEVNATYDSITQKWTNDDTGEVLDKVNEAGDVVQAWHPDKQWFELSDVMKEIGDSLKDIVEYTINAADAMLTFVEGATGMSDPIEIAKTAIEGVITAFEFCFDVVTTLIGLLFEFEQPIMVAINLTRMLGLALELVVEAVVGVVKNAIGAIVNLIATAGQKIRQLYNGVLKHIPDSIKAELGLTPMDENVNEGIISAIDKMHTNDWEHIKQTFASLTDPNSYYSSYQDMFGKVTNNSHDGVENKHTLWNWYVDGIRKQNEKDKNNKEKSPYSMNSVKGNPNPTDKDADKKAKAAQRAADKANREAIRESQRMLKERQQALKEILDDTLNRLKEELRKTELAYKQGFLTIEEYFTKKAEIERAEAEARLKEAQEERVAIENSEFNSKYEKLAALHKVDREIRKYSLEVGKSVTAQKELTKLFGQFNDIIANSNLNGTLNRINSGNGNISLSKDDNDFKYKADQSVKVLESLAPNGLEWVVDEIVNQAIANGVEPALAVAIAKNESGFNQNAISPAGAIGIGQLMPDTAASLGVNPYDWKQNILGMIKYIKELRETFDGDIAKVIAAYNAGPAAVKTYGGIPPYPETQAYYENVASTRDSVIGSGYDLFDTDINRLNDVNQKLWQSQQANTQAVQSNTQSINGIQIDTRELGNIVASAPDNPDIEDASDATKLFMQAVGNAWKKLHPELSPLEVSSAFRAGNTNSHHGYGEAFDVVNDYFDNPKLREEYVNLINSLGGKGLSEWTSDEAPGVYRSGSNIHATTPNSNYGNGGIFSASTPSSNTLNKLPQPQADTEDITDKAREAINALIKETNNATEEIRTGILAEKPDSRVSFQETYNRLDELDKIAERYPAARNLADKLRMLLRQKEAKLDTEFYEGLLETNLDTMQRNGTKIANRIATGDIDYEELSKLYKKYFSYVMGTGEDVEETKKRYEELNNKLRAEKQKWATEVDKDAKKTNGELIAEAEKNYKDLNDKLYELQSTDGVSEEEISEITKKLEEARAHRNKLYSDRDFKFKDLQDAVDKLGAHIKEAVQNPINQIIMLEKNYLKQQDLGNVNAAKEIEKRLESARKSLYDIFDTWIKAVEDKFDIMSNYFAEMPVTNLQREQGERELKAFRNQELLVQNQHKLSGLREDYLLRTYRIAKNEQEIKEWTKIRDDAKLKGNENNNKYVEASNHIKELEDDSQAAKLAMSELDRQIGDTENIIRLEKELSKLPDLFRDAGKVAKQALEDGLVTFLTDGVNEAGSLKDALLDLAQTFLKTMQEFFAKQMVTTLMNALFGHYDTEGNGERNDLFKRATVPQEIETDNENVKKVVYFSGADRDIVGGEWHYTDENAKATVKALKDEGIIARLDENGKGYSVPVSSDEASKWYTDYVKNTTVEKGNQTLDGIKSEVSQKDNQDVVNAVQDSGTKITSTLAETNAKLDVIHSDLVQGNVEEQENNTEEQENNEEEQANQADENFEQQQQTQAVQSMEAPIEDIDVSTERTADNTEGSGSSSSSSGGVGTESGAAGGSVAPMGNYLKLSNEGFSKALEPINGFLNNSVFGDIFNGLEGMLGSAGAQLGGMVFGVKTLFDGDKKEKLLSMIFLELQLIYTTLQASMSASTAAGHATGGFIRGAGTSTSDSIPAMLSNGEYVISADSVRKYGTNFMNAVNDGTFTQIPLGVPKFADGGFVGDTVSEETARGMSSFAGQIANNVSTTTNMSVALVGNQDEAMEHFMKSPRAQRIMLDFSRKTARFSSTLSGRF